MTTTLIQTIILDYDHIEIHYNTILKNKPYLVRVYNWDSSEPKELRLDKTQLDKLYLILRKDNLL